MKNKILDLLKFKSGLGKVKSTTSHKNDNTETVLKQKQEAAEGVDYFLDGQTILERPELSALVLKIRASLEVSPQYFDTHFLPVIVACAGYCQKAPAASSHHHSFPYGLITHLLEVALYSLRASRGFLYNPTNREGAVDELKHLYAYAVFVASMFHDMGKIITDLHFYVRDPETQRFVTWSPLMSSPPGEILKIEYRIERRIRKQSQANLYLYDSHKIASTILIDRIVPKISKEWICGSHPKLQLDMYHAIYGDYSNADVIGASVSKGESTSVAQGQTNVSEITNKNDPSFKLKSAVIQTLSNPAASGFKVDHSGFRNYAKVEGMIYVAGNALQQALKTPCKAMGVNLPEVESKFEQMITNQLSIPAPSGDSMWWVSFVQEGKEHDPKKKDIKCFAFDALLFDPDGALVDDKVNVVLGKGSLSEEEKLEREKDEARVLFERNGVVTQAQEDKVIETKVVDKGNSSTKNNGEEKNNNKGIEKVTQKGQAPHTNKKPSSSTSQASKEVSAPKLNPDALASFLTKPSTTIDEPENPKSSVDSKQTQKSNSKKEVKRKQEVISKGNKNNETKSTDTDTGGLGDRIPPPAKVAKRSTLASSSLNLSNLETIGQDIKESPSSGNLHEEQSPVTETDYSNSDDNPPTLQEPLLTETDLTEEATRVDQKTLKETTQTHEPPAQLDYMDMVLMDSDLLSSIPTSSLNHSDSDGSSMGVESYEAAPTELEDLLSSLSARPILPPAWASCKNSPSIESINNTRELFRYIQVAIDNRSIRFNAQNGWLHKVDGGIFLTSPAAFGYDTPLGVNMRFQTFIKNSHFLVRFDHGGAPENHNLVRAAMFTRKRTQGAPTLKFTRFLWGFYLATDNHFKLTYQEKPIRNSRFCVVDKDSVRGDYMARVDS
ncbi:TraI domain-containing protein [Vibrio crassostreae]|uniref:TraI domain-containing protein n=1 Tax=Vibrio crassostreae TaxID=246167 RepID=UPI001B307A40|nr:TraI domain-containing protein [Vibrio crassostreae]